MDDPDWKSGPDDKNTHENERFQISGSTDASAQDFLPTDPDLLTVAQKWASPPLAVRAGILAMVNATVPDAAAPPD